MATPVVFFETDPDVIVNRIIARTEELLGKVIHPAQTERLLIQSFAYEIVLTNTAGNTAANQMFAEFATAPVLDYLAQNVGLSRLPEAFAKCTIRFNLIGSRVSTIVIPIGTRVTSIDGLSVFVTLNNISVLVGPTYVDIECESQDGGISSNGYANGTISLILDPQSFIVSASNTTVPSGGASEESDEQLRVRIRLAFNAPSTAGSFNSYKLATLGAHPSIIDANIIGTGSGGVSIYPLTNTGVATTIEVLNAVLAACNDEEVRPITDTPIAISPTFVPYNVLCEITKLSSGDDIIIIDTVKSKLIDYISDSKTKLGRDITQDKLTALAMVDNVYSVTFTGFSDVIVGGTEVASCDINNILNFDVTVVATVVG